MSSQSDRVSPRTSVAAAVPCHNEAATIARVIAGLAAGYPFSEIVVFDNASTDGTAEAARGAGATVHDVPVLGKGNAVRAAFAVLEADVIVLIDGDGTYDPADVASVIEPVLRGEADMVIGRRTTLETRRALPLLRRLANRAITATVGLLFGIRLHDALSGYRAVSRDLVSRAELESDGFDIEIEMLAASCRLGLRVWEVPVGYREREAGSVSKLAPVPDALRILATAYRLRSRRR